MSYEYFVIALLCLLIGLAVSGIGAFSIWKQNIHPDKDANSVGSKIEIPLLGKVTSNAPAVALCVVGLFSVIIAYWVVQEGAKQFTELARLKKAQPDRITFTAKVAYDPSGLKEEFPNYIIVGLAPGDGTAFRLINVKETPDKQESTVELRVPESWSSFNAFAFAVGSSEISPHFETINAESEDFSIKLAK